MEQPPADAAEWNDDDYLPGGTDVGDGGPVPIGTVIERDLPDIVAATSAPTDIAQPPGASIERVEEPPAAASPAPDVAAAVQSGLDAMASPAPAAEYRSGDMWLIGGDGAVHYGRKGKWWLCGKGQGGAELGDAYPGVTPAGACIACRGITPPKDDA